MKKLLALVIALMLCLAGSVALAEEAPETYALNEDTLTLEQGPVWFFQYYDAAEDGIFDLHATPNWGDNWQFSESPDADQVYHSICEWDGIQAMPGTWIGEFIDIVVCFKAPKAGTVVIAPMEFVVKDDGNEWPAYLAKIEVSAADGTFAKVFPAEGDWAETPVTTEEIELAVEEGTLIHFVVRAGDDGGAAVSVMPVISYK